jgi:hypothetical protein
LTGTWHIAGLRLTGICAAFLDGIGTAFRDPTANNLLAGRERNNWHGDCFDRFCPLPRNGFESSMPLHNLPISSHAADVATHRSEKRRGELPDDVDGRQYRKDRENFEGWLCQFSGCAEILADDTKPGEAKVIGSSAPADESPFPAPPGLMATASSFPDQALNRSAVDEGELATPAGQLPASAAHADTATMEGASGDRPSDDAPEWQGQSGADRTEFGQAVGASETRRNSHLRLEPRQTAKNVDAEHASKLPPLVQTAGTAVDPTSRPEVPAIRDPHSPDSIDLSQLATQHETSRIAESAGHLPGSPGNLNVSAQPTTSRTSEISASASPATAGQSHDLSQPDALRVLRQIASAPGLGGGLRAVTAHRGTTVHIALDPPSLGELTVEIRRTESACKVHIIADRSQTHALLERNVDTLIGSLLEQGDGNVEVDISHRQSDQQRQPVPGQSREARQQRVSPAARNVVPDARTRWTTNSVDMII